MQEEMEALLNRRWIRKAEDKELYYKIRDQLGEIRKFATEKMGCPIVENTLLVKMEKVPVQPQPFMGIREFASQEEYAFFCVLLMFLEDREPGEQFILSQLTDYAAANLPGGAPDWTSYTQRRRLIRVLRYAQAQGLLDVTDGSDENFMNGTEGDVLYENTGASRYFVRNFSRDILGFEKPEDFFQSQWVDIQEDRGIARRHRVYNRLLFSPGVYLGDGAQEDFDYLRNYGRRMEAELEEKLGCSLQIHKGCAFLVEREDCRLGETLPGNNAASDCILLFCSLVRKKVEQGSWKPGPDEMLWVDPMELEALLRELRENWQGSLTKNYREMTEGEWIREMEGNLESWTVIQSFPERRQIRISPLAGKIAGRYADPEEEVPQTAQRKRRRRRKQA